MSSASEKLSYGGDPSEGLAARINMQGFMGNFSDEFSNYLSEHQLENIGTLTTSFAVSSLLSYFDNVHVQTITKW